VFRWFILCLVASVLGAAPPAGEFRQRREKLRESTQNDVFILIGNTEAEAAAARSGFFQEPNFYYLTGWNEPGAALVLTPRREALFIPRRDPESEKWTGRKAAFDDREIQSLTGFETVLAVESLESKLPDLLEDAPKVYLLTGSSGARKIESRVSLREVSNARLPIARLRMVKSRFELSLIEKSIEASVQAHRAGWSRVASGVYEYEVASAMSAAYFERGCGRHAYPPIVGSGPAATVLHYWQNSRRMDAGELLLMDVGAECGNYAADITRTVPVNGKFTARQLELYNVVLGAQQAAIAAVRPGVTIGKTTANSIYKIAYDYIDSHGKARDGKPLGRYFTHGIGHHIGLEVHDAHDEAMPLAPGMVITVEPGLYIPEERIGIRIEDVVLVTAGGPQVLTSALPKDPRMVEEALAKR
jgi:Xaa-Pro aminopeptidase